MNRWEWIPTPTSPNGSLTPTPHSKNEWDSQSGIPNLSLNKLSKYWNRKNPHSSLPLQKVNTPLREPLL